MPPSPTPLAALLPDPQHRAFWDTAFTAALTGLASRKAYTGNTAVRFPDDLVEDAALIAGAATETRAALFAAAAPPPPVTHVEGTTRITSYPPPFAAQPSGPVASSSIDKVVTR